MFRNSSNCSFLSLLFFLKGNIALSSFTIFSLLSIMLKTIIETLNSNWQDLQIRHQNQNLHTTSLKSHFSLMTMLSIYSVMNSILVYKVGECHFLKMHIYLGERHSLFRESNKAYKYKFSIATEMVLFMFYFLLEFL